MNPFMCVVCGEDTNEGKEYYMVHDHVWPIGDHDGMLCIGCLEKKIGRELNSNDFPPLLINEMFEQSDRLKNRLQKGGP